MEILSVILSLPILIIFNPAIWVFGIFSYINFQDKVTRPIGWLAALFILIAVLILFLTCAAGGAGGEFTGMLILPLNFLMLIIGVPVLIIWRFIKLKKHKN